MSLAKNLAENIRKFRGFKTQDWLAERIGVVRATVNRWENQGAESVTVAQLDALSVALSVPVKALLGLEPPQPTGEIPEDLYRALKTLRRPEHIEAIRAVVEGLLLDPEDFSDPAPDAPQGRPKLGEKS